MTGERDHTSVLHVLLPVSLAGLSRELVSRVELARARYALPET